MTKRHHYRKRMVETPELNITTFLNLMVVLIPFLLISAVFSRVTIMELSVPTSAGGAISNTPNFAIEVIVRYVHWRLVRFASVHCCATILSDNGIIITAKSHKRTSTHTKYK